MELTKRRPKHLNLLQIRLPLPGVASILHRLSGFAMFLLLPLVIWMFGESVRSPESHDALRMLLAHPLAKLVQLGLLWALLHHLCMGIRILLIDMHIGVEKNAAKKSAIAVFALSLGLTVLLGAKLW